MVTCPTFAEELCHLRQRIAENPCEIEVRFYRALTCVASNELDLAVVELLQLVASNPNNPSFFYYLGYVESERARYKEAVRHFSAAIELDAVFIDAINDRGVVYALMKRYHDAIKDYDRVLAIDPDLAEAYNNRGISMVRLRRYKEAKADYDHAIRLY